MAPCHQDTGEGGLSPAHRAGGGDLVFQIGTGYFGCRDKQGHFSLDMLKETLDGAPVKALEIKLSQGAKAGIGGHLPGPKVTEEIAKIRGVPAHEDCISPPRHSAFEDPDSMLDFAEMLADETGLPVGIKAAVGRMDPWEELAELMARRDRGVDFIVIDGGEGGTGAAPLVFADHVGLPFKIGFSRVYGAFARRGIQDHVTWVGSGRLGFPEQAVFAMALGCDLINIAREAMLSVGCIQAQKCHTGECPTGVATQNQRLARGLEPQSKSVRCSTYIRALRGEMLSVSRALGVPHPALVHPDQLELVDEGFRARTVTEAFHYEPEWREVTAQRREEMEQLVDTSGHPRASTVHPETDTSPRPLAGDAA
jgi:glutamate synthase domain-containing protein 2